MPRVIVYLVSTIFRPCHVELMFLIADCGQEGCWMRMKMKNIMMPTLPPKVGYLQLQMK